MTMMDGGGEGPQASSFSPEVQQVVDTLLAAAAEADNCLKSGNKAAGRRARKGLGEVKKMLTPLRATILASMKGESAGAA